MRIDLHIGVEHCGAARLQSVLAAKRDHLTAKGIRYANAPGNKNHTRLWMAVTDPGHVDPLRYNRGFIPAEKQADLRASLQAALMSEVSTHKPDQLILSASQLCWLATDTELTRLRDLLAPLSEDIRIIAHVDEQARLLTRIYADQIHEGRAASLDQELSIAGRENWWDSALKFAPEISPNAGIFLENQAAPFWLDYRRLVQHWEAVFGAGKVDLCAYDEARFASDAVTEDIRHAFRLPDQIGKAAAGKPTQPASAATLARGRQLNELILRVLQDRKRVLPRQLWRSFIQEISLDGAPIDPASLSAVSKNFTKDNRALAAAHTGLTADLFKRGRAKAQWTEADPEYGFRPSQYLLSFMWRIDKATREERDAKSGAAAPATPQAHDLSESARQIMPPLAVQNFEKLKGSPFAPHNRLGAVNEEDLAAAYPPMAPRQLAPGSSGNVIVGCMKNEAPYILEWVAYHRAIGVDNFLIYTNGCEDGTSELLDRLQELGVLQHRLNDDWRGNSPQQFALNRALEEPVIRNADWIIHIDVDEFMNVRYGNGTLDDFLARVPDATNVAMTWRLFGHNGVTELRDELVIDQFDTCAPKFCPKPHTVWGFKTMFKNIGAYEKISCHRPNKLIGGMEERVKWVNGSGQDMTREAAKSGWRNSKKTIGYDLIQLNHYALRSAESFLIKRQRGRALHVDRSIGLNYWIRMDWSDHRDITIKRNVPRVEMERNRLLQDDRLRQLHEDGLKWHRAKADELHGKDEFRELYEQALRVKLTQTERVAYALALDMES
ncbi:glycosyltransferase family 2 protein [Aliishimia ponticola]|uniref:Glycosyltransferase family 2 protein n=1 Tax=Aliishimia ponticola TaxID=2499833 RepID=A0A4S4NKQ7_9RHOB|nr:glycosyltransferase family 2 protein [Aliishimia ponticola]THH38878.1 glycosyltransferase family 2 protein [Aliishimia ponticola]